MISFQASVRESDIGQEVLVVLNFDAFKLFLIITQRCLSSALAADMLLDMS